MQRFSVDHRTAEEAESELNSEMGSAFGLGLGVVALVFCEAICAGIFDVLVLSRAKYGIPDDLVASISQYVAHLGK